jgi:hypothetical protein
MSDVSVKRQDQNDYADGYFGRSYDPTKRPIQGSKTKLQPK